MKYLRANSSSGDMSRLEIFRNEMNGEVYDQNVLRSHNLDGSACRWLDDGQDQELLYIVFGNGDNKHATGGIFMGDIFNYTTKIDAFV